MTRERDPRRGLRKIVRRRDRRLRKDPPKSYRPGGSAVTSVDGRFRPLLLALLGAGIAVTVGLLLTRALRPDIENSQGDPIVETATPSGEDGPEVRGAELLEEEVNVPVTDSSHEDPAAPMAPTETESGANPVTGLEAELGTEHGTGPGTEHGTGPETELGTDSGTVAVAPPGATPGTGEGTASTDAPAEDSAPRGLTDARPRESRGSSKSPLIERDASTGPTDEAPAGWSEDPETGVSVWLPSWFRDGTYELEVEVPHVDGLAHGTGRVVLTASEPGDSDRTFEGRFHLGHYYGEQTSLGNRLPSEDHVPPSGLHFLRTDSFLYRLADSPDPEFTGIAFWLRNEFGVRIAADPCYVRTNGRPDLLVIVPDDFPRAEDEAMERAMREGWRLYQELCPEVYYADVFVLPSVCHYEPQRSARIPEYSPLLAQASFYGKVGERLSISR